MKKITSSLLQLSFVTLLIGCLTSLAFAQERGNEKPRVSPNATVSQTVGTTDITITYGRPAVNNREIFGNLIPYGEVWRTGANESTALVVSKDVTIEGHKLKAGTYSLYTIPGKDKWTIIINSKLSWGTQYDSSKDLFRFEVESRNADYIERMMFYFTDVSQESATIVLHWDQTKVPFTIKV